MPLAELLMERFKVKTFAVENPELTSVGTTAIQVFGNNPNRLAWIFVNLHDTGVIYLGLTNAVSATRGVRIAPGGGKATMVWDEDFQTTAWAIWGLASAASISCYAIEVVAY